MATAVPTSPISVTVNVTVPDFASLQTFLDALAGKIAGTVIQNVQVGQASY